VGNYIQHVNNKKSGAYAFIIAPTCIISSNGLKNIKYDKGYPGIAIHTYIDPVPSSL